MFDPEPSAGMVQTAGYTGEHRGLMTVVTVIVTVAVERAPGAQLSIVGITSGQ